MSYSSSFRISRFPVPASVFNDVHSRLSHLTQGERDFVLHVLCSNVINLNKIRHQGLDGWLDVGIDLPCDWIGAKFPKVKAAKIDPQVISFEEYSTARHQCRSFVASLDLLDAMLGWSPADMTAAAAEPIVNVFDGKTYEVQAPKARENGIFSPKIINDARRVLTACPFNFDAVTEHLEESKARVPPGATEEDRTRLERIFRNDNGCAARIRAGCHPTGDGFATYQPEFRTIYTGRIMEVGGGSQSCSREMKAAMFSEVPGLKNYDLKRSQAFILLQELEDAGLPHAWVDRYAKEKDANELRAAALGISKESYKTCLYATIMGAHHAKHWVREANKMYRCILEEECERDEAKAKMLTLKVHAALAPLKLEVDAWHDYLMNDAGCAHVDPTYKSVRTLKNACGQHFKLEGKGADKLARKAAAFILQGQEAAFIHRLTALGKKFGFIPVSNQHDGLVVVGEVPTTAVNEAAKAAGLRYATLEVKPFV